MAKTVISDLLQIFRSSVSAVLPETLIRNTVKYNPVNQNLTIFGDTYNLLNKNVYLVGFGKAVQNMAHEIENVLNTKLNQGIVSIPVGSINKSETKSLYLEGARNNLPDEDAFKTTVKIDKLVTNLGKEDFLLVLISGGGSALLPFPKASITLEEKTALIVKLAKSGADIKELNTVRKSLSGLKGGGLATKAQPAQVVSLILSDIVGDPLDLIASGPTTENKDHPSKAMDIIAKYGFRNSLPQSISKVLMERSSEKFPKDNVKNYIIGSNKLSLEAACNEARKLNYSPLVLSDSVTGNVTDIAKEYVKLVKLVCKYIKQDIFNAEFLKPEHSNLNMPGLKVDFLQDIERNSNKFCLILGGELTVEVKGGGKGGRNQQLALEFSKYVHDEIKYLNDFDVHLLSAGTDGIDGPTDAAGAIGYIDLINDSTNANIDVNKYLANNDSYNFYKILKDGTLHVFTGHTNTNVMDIHIITISKKI